MLNPMRVVCTGSPALLKLMLHCMAKLQQLTACSPDWSLDIACHAKVWQNRRQLCQDVLAFLHNPESYAHQEQTDLQGSRHLRG